MARDWRRRLERLRVDTGLRCLGCGFGFCLARTDGALVAPFVFDDRNLGTAICAALWAGRSVLRAEASLLRRRVSDVSVVSSVV